MTATASSTRGTPIKERTDDQVRQDLAGKDEDVLQQFLRLRDYAHEKGLGLSALAQQSAIPSSIISQGFNGTYPGDWSEVANRIDTFFWRLEQNRLYGGLREFVETNLTSALWAVFEKIRQVRRIQLVEGPEQCMKSRAAVEYAARNNSGRTVYLEVPGGTNSASEFIWALADRLGIPYSVKLSEKRLRIRHALAACDLLIIDEAHIIFEEWRADAIAHWFNYLRTDLFANGSRGVVLIATNTDLMASINTWRRKSRYNVGQLLGRMRNDVIRIDPAEDILLEDVATIVRRYYEASDAVVAELRDIALRPQLGHVGILFDILNESWTEAKQRKRPMSDASVRRTASAVLENARTNRKEFVS